MDGKKKLEELVASVADSFPVTVSADTIRSISDAYKAMEAERDALRERENAAREFVKRHPSLTLIDLAEFEAFLKMPSAIDAALKGSRHEG